MSAWTRCSALWVAVVVIGGGLAAAMIAPLRLSTRSTPTIDEGPDPVLSLDHEKDRLAPGVLSLPKALHRKTILPEGTGLGWPTLLGPNLDGTSPEKGLNLQWPAAGPWEKWRIAVGDAYASPVALGNSLILFDRREDREVIDCLDPETGTSRWQTSWLATYQCPYIHSSGPYAAPVLEEGRVYAFGAAGDLYCLRLDDGQEVWHRNLHHDFEARNELWPVSVSPLIENDRLIINVGGRKTHAGIVALDKNTGQTLWTATDDGASCSMARAATIHGRRYLFVWTAEALVSLDPADGKVHWRIPFAAKNIEAAHGTTPMIADDLVLISGYELGSKCLRIQPDGSYEELWTPANRRLLDSQYNTLIYVDGNVCGFSAAKRALRCLNLETGEMRWQWRNLIRLGTTIAVDGGAIVFGECGRLASLELSPKGVSVRSITRKPVLEPRCVSYPALHNGLLYLRNEHEMVAIDLRRETDSIR